ncbi:TATA box-binding protein [candidate division MSBL1 archaeon SCGC-AAA261F19]|uniref:DNA helicase n=2 Tax=candidate division MSBL1 TaxID=215777 RepID=A0A133VAA7_9EURY|nr:TATA box-binding protein [candidate division MSBL1 archaeon SCGC-AAA261D19]KXB03364.1 TATA box-binding protein [candidate division MSBL1 archaeon SCGC-AAA261F19]
MPEISEIPEAEGGVEFERISAHTHIRGLGLDDEGKARDIGDGMVGQKKAREAAGRVVNLVKKGKLGGRAVLLAGPPGTGKTATAVAMARELGEDVPFIQLSGSQIFSAERDKTEILMESLRKALGIRLREMREVYEGEVASMKIETGQAAYNPYQRTASRAKITLRTKDEKKSLRLGSSVATSLQNQQVKEGDVIQIDAETGRIMKLGESRDSWKGEEADISVSPNLVDVPVGEIKKEREFVSTLNIHQIDSISARQARGGLSLFFGGGEAEIDNEIREATDRQVKEWIDGGKGELLPGVLFLDEVHMLDIEAFSFFNRAMEREFSPIVILASNRGVTKIRGTDYESPHGMPLDLLDRLLIIDTHPYKKEEIKSILKIRAGEEEVELSEGALDYLSEIGENTSMRYAVQLIAPANEVAESRNRKKVEKEDAKEARRLFISVKDSIDILKQYEEKMMD